MIRIDKVNAQIAIQTIPAKMTISQPKADFEMSIRHPKVEIHTDPVRVKIDQSECFNESGLMNLQAMSDENAARGKRAAAEAIDKIVYEGNRMAAIENKVDAIAEIALDNSLSTIDYNIGLTPTSRPKIDFVGGTVDIKVHEGYVDIKAKPNMPIIEVQAGIVNITLEQKPEIRITYLGNKLDKSV